MTSQLHTKYRPRNLDKIIGQEAAVARLKGVIESKKYPSAILLVGPSSAGKTTIARAFVCELFGVKTLDNHPDWKEINASDSRGIDDVRDMLKVARLRPQRAPKRVILLDEAQGFTGPSADLLLKPLEEPPPNTMFILGSMEPEKLKTALKNRCSTFVLQAPSQADITKYVNRVAKGEFGSKLPADITDHIVQNCNGEMRTAANIIQSIVETNPKDLKKLKASQLMEIITSTESNDEVLAVNMLDNVYAGHTRGIYRCAMDVQEGFRFINRLLTMNTFLINSTVLNGEKHKSVWWSKPHIEISKAVKKSLGDLKAEGMLPILSMVQSELIDLRARSGAFMVNEQVLIADAMFKSAVLVKKALSKK